MACKKQVVFYSKLGARMALVRLQAKGRDVKAFHWCPEHRGYHTTRKKGMQ